MNLSNEKQIIREYARSLGFLDARFTGVELENEWKEHYEDFLRVNEIGEMDYLRNHMHIRMNPELLFPGTKSILVLLYRYDDSEYENVKDQALVKISRYASGRDYHRFLRKQGKRLLEKIKETLPGVNGRITVDTAPVSEKYFAKKSGAGFQGKNTCIIHPEYGSWFNLSLIFLNLEVEPDHPISYSCGSCTRCIDACPTQALTKRGISPEKCISYMNIEKRSPLSYNELEQIQNHLAGCDLCQEVCPYNHKESVFSSRVPGALDSRVEVLEYMKNPSIFTESSWDRFSRGMTFRRSNLENWNQIIQHSHR